MENRKYVKFLIPIFVLGFFIFNINNVFAYDTDTHAFLTDEIAKFYNKNFSNNSISAGLTPYLIDGSRREDDIPRWMNHFYDPVYNRGLSYDPKIDFINLGDWQKSKDWAQDSSNQNSLTYKVPATIASILTALEQGEISAISAETEFTWQKAVEFYVQGDEEKAMFMLGHVLHLVEDASVPDHTRNDPHPYDSPYEIYTSQFNLSNPDKNLNIRLNNKSPIILANLNFYFDELANYSNNSFYSKDTIGVQSGYNLPEPDYFQTLEDGRRYGIHPDNDLGDYPIVMAKGLLELKTNELLNRPLIMSAYWSRLSTKSVQYGSGVVNLFFQQAEAAKNQNTTQSKSFLSQAIDAISGFFSDIFGNNQNLQPAGRVSLENNLVQSTGQPDNQTGQTINQQTIQSTQTSTAQKQTQQTNLNQTQIDDQDENLQPDQPIDEQQINEQQTDEQQAQETQQNQLTQTAQIKQCSFSTTQSPSRQGLIINEVAWMGATDDANNEWIELKNISNADININNWQLIDKAEQIKINLSDISGNKSIKPNQLILLERTDDNSVPNITADLIYTGALSNTDEGIRLFDGQCNLIDEVLASPDWPAGNNTSASERKTMERDASGFNWHTSSIINGTPKAENSTPIIYGGGGSSGNQITTQTNTQQQTTTNPSTSSGQAKILINEIQISPIADRFIKLYNPNDSAINLTNYYIQRKTRTGANFSSLITKTYFENKTIPARGYLLIARNEVGGLTLTESNTIQIKNPDGEVIDKVGWGQASDCEGSCAIQPGENQSIKRKFQNNTFTDTDNNLQDFELQTSQANQAPGAFFVSSQSNNVVISEIYPDKTGDNYDFVEFYNPTESLIDLSNYSLRILKEDATSSQLLADFSGETNHQISAKGFFLVGFDNYAQSASTSVDASRSSKSLPSTKSAVIILQNSDDIVDEIQYNPDNLTIDQSYERKFFYNGNCGPAQDDGEFLGNGCAEASFDVRQIAKPQNSLSLPEPRNAPTIPQNFNAIFSSSTMQLDFNWQPSQDYSGATSIIKYQISNLSTSQVYRFKTTSTEAKITIDEVGRDYEFSIQAFDKDDLGSETAPAEISVPSLLSGLYFYTDPRDTNKNLIEAYYDNYPFTPDLFGQNKWNLVVFYLNSNVLGIKYNQCNGGFSTENSLILPNSQDYCGTSGGAYSSALKFSQLEDNHFIIQLASSSQDITPTNNDFITMALYTTYSTQTMDGRIPDFQLVAVDKTKYYFGQPPIHEPPQLNGLIDLTFDSQNSRLNLNWQNATDSDTLNPLLTYEAKYNDSEDWQSLNNATGTSRLVSPGDNFVIGLRAKDDFNNYSNPILTANWFYPTTNFYISQTEANNWSSAFGQKDGTEAAAVNLQSITPQEDFQFNKVVLKIRQAPTNNSANLKLSVYADNGSNQPDFTNQLSAAIIQNVFNPDENQEMTFSFNNSISFNTDNKYWFVLEVDDYNATNSYNAWHSNSWQNAVADGNIYLDGESGKIQKNWDNSYSSFNTTPDQDWYMKIGLQL